MLPHHVNSWTIPVDLGIVSRESAKIPKMGTKFSPHSLFYFKRNTNDVHAKFFSDSSKNDYMISKCFQISQTDPFPFCHAYLQSSAEFK